MAILPDVNSYIQFVQSAILDLFGKEINLFVQMGKNLFRGFALILVVWSGVKAALRAASGGEGFDFSELASLILTIAFCYAMVTYYASPIPGIGQSFYRLVGDEGASLADTIGEQEFSQMSAQLNGLIEKISGPDQSIWDLFPLYAFVEIFLLTAILKFVAFAVIAFGYIAFAVLALVGPVFIPFFIVPKLDFLFWGWFKSFLQYAFYPVIANAFLFVVSKLMLHFLGIFTASDWSSKATIVAQLPLLTILFLAAIYGIIKIPMIVSHLFSGSSGQGSGDMVSGAVSAVKGAVAAAAL